MPRIWSFQQTQERYPSLRVLSVICTILGVLLELVASSILVFAFYHFAEGGAGLALALGFWSVGCGVAGLQFLASGALFLLAIHIEENTRATAQALERIRAGMEPKPVADALVFES